MSKTKILGFSGKKQSGKTSSTNFLFGLEMISIGMISQMRIDKKGRLCVPIIKEDGSHGEGCIDPVDPRPEARDYYAQTIWPFLKVYQLADPLKWICMNVLGLTFEQCNGSNADKDSKTNIKWENLPGIISNELVYDSVEEAFYEAKPSPEALINCEIGKYHKSGFMTAREVMQYVGTDIFRRMYNDCWIDATIRIINQEAPELAIVSDVRFPNEVEGIQKAGGKVIRFTRNPCSDGDQHPSEIALDDKPEDYFDAVIHNNEMSIPQQNEAVHNTLVEWDFLNLSVEVPL